MRDWKNEEIKIREDVILKKICDEYVLFAIREAARYCRHVQTLNETAGYFWEMLEKGYSFTQMVSEASEEFDVPRETISADLINLLDQFSDLHYIL